MRRRHKTLATWLAFVGGPLGLHRFYLFGAGDVLAWLAPIPTALGFWGLERVRQFGLDDVLSWVLIPLMGMHIAGCCLAAIVYGLSSRERWNRLYNEDLDANDPAGGTNWLTVIAAALALLIGTGTLVGSIAYGLQRYFEVQIEAARALSQ